MSVQVLGRAELQLGDTSLLVLLDRDLIGLGEVALFPPHHPDELFQILDFLGLHQIEKLLVCHYCANKNFHGLFPLTIACPCPYFFNKYILNYSFDISSN